MGYRVFLRVALLATIFGAGQPVSSLFAQPTASLSPAANPFAATYNGTYRINAGSRRGETGTFALRVAENSAASATRRSSRGETAVYYGNVNAITGAFRLIANPAAGSSNRTTSSITGRLVEGTATINGNAVLAFSDGNRGVINLSAPLTDGLNSFAGSYYGTSAITSGPGIGVTTSASIIINEDGTASGVLYGQEGSTYNLSGAANNLGLFNLRNRSGSRSVVTASGRLSDSGGSGTFAIVSGPIVVRGTITLNRRPAPVNNPFAGNYSGTMQITSGPGTGTGASITLSVGVDSSARATSRDAAGNTLSFFGIVAPNGVISLRSVVRGVNYTLSGRLRDSGNGLGGEATYASSTGGRGRATLSQPTTTANTTDNGATDNGTSTANTIVGDYNATYRSAESSGTIGLHIGNDGVATGVVRDDDGNLLLLTGTINLTTGNFTLRSTGNVRATFSGQLTAATGMYTGNGNLAFGANDRSAVLLSRVEAAPDNPFVGVYRGAYQTEDGPDADETGTFKMRVDADGSATGMANTDDDEDNNDATDEMEMNEDTLTGNVDFDTGRFRLQLSTPERAITMIGQLDVINGTPRTVRGRGTYADAQDNKGTILLTKE